MSNERRAALEAAFDAAEAEEEGTETELEVEVPDEQEEQADSTNLGTEPQEGDSTSAKKAAKAPDAQKVEQDAANRLGSKKPSEVQKAGSKGAEPQAADTGVKPPQSWTPAEREHWNKVPREAQAAIQRRELEVQQALSRSADSRKFQDSFVKTVQPYAHLIRAQNSHPLQAVDNLMKTAAGLTVGTQPQKAAIVAEIIQNYGIDIQVLDDVLSKRPIQQQQAAPGALPPQFADALRPIHQFMSQQEQARAQHIQHIQSEATQIVEQFETKLPFFDDLRDDIADLMEVAAARGKIMTIEQAHTIAVNANPEIKKIIDQRARAAKINSDPNKINRARKAGSSIKGAPNGAAMAGSKPNSRRAALSEAWDDQA